ncbi:bifunctional diaminohydroxyphosphoribosylaminopyrimidine deaminase/5-amino-6-(5-phosphoribosylamino)uracil reductase RibD [Brachybacterium sp. EF45031]|uniref:bifunctional diaminohydroxyphosphoribosylaminopyrimidine deaminase/5-amino-6-(5-phosphoribosylamino)uracil reductase RibD n=1 Tax=Brachybacterium sillae TaxID=2810536 RepID=UPI00217EEDD9|nr:bifunctional diaminohydroxyphosphoribosylaminopyrimidine deaminase/5-amino-6-(5-phosphoribosylamino)uracil reductase RibD [Brachybacterium sillae]MCS6711903.1 bifunctional diaminohydroxyphosphoribosylaminopyrimidine deaminase/5-amino-6-(5-phosphoribosylamino)uracil reductase RibD [Brachybacterium sillae]
MEPTPSTVAPLPEALLRRILEAAALGPIGANPRVGAALVAPDGTILALGHHRGAGTPHAEADALAAARAAGHDVRGATCVVTLEPCAHQGRTPSCARALITAGIGAVRYAVPDPHAPAAGGARLLTDAGIDTGRWDDPALTAEAEALNRRWLQAITQERPLVTAKVAQTLDGRIAAADGTSQWITGPEGRAAGHALRAVVDAIAVGTGTALADDPALTARTPDGALHPHQPLRVVLGRRPLPPEARLHRTDGGPVLQFDGRDLAADLRLLRRDHGVEHLLLEGGAGLLAAALRADLVDDLWVHLAPTLLGEGRSGVGPLGIATLAHRLDLDLVPGSVQQLGRDLLFHAQPAPRRTA